MCPVAGGGSRRLRNLASLRAQWHSLPARLGGTFMQSMPQQDRLFTVKALLSILFSLVCLLAATRTFAEVKSLGPDGGDVRRISFDLSNPNQGKVNPLIRDCAFTITRACCGSAGWNLPQPGCRRKLVTHHSRKPSAFERYPVASGRSAESRDHLCRHLASGMEDIGWRKDLEADQEWNDR